MSVYVWDFSVHRNTLPHTQCDLREFIKSDLCSLAAQFPTVYWALARCFKQEF